MKSVLKIIRSIFCLEKSDAPQSSFVRESVSKTGNYLTSDGEVKVVIVAAFHYEPNFFDLEGACSKLDLALSALFKKFGTSQVLSLDDEVVEAIANITFDTPYIFSDRVYIKESTPRINRGEQPISDWAAREMARNLLEEG